MNGPKVNSLPAMLVTAWTAFGYMLENPSIRPVLVPQCVVSSDNLDGAENQQERLRQERWVIGFVDGEGCFSIGLVRQSGGRGRVGYRTGVNRQKPGADLLRILRGHTPNIQDTG
jgi:hypothetical protein